MENKIYVAVVDSHPVVRAGLITILDKIGFINPSEFEDTEALLNVLTGTGFQPDICIIDVNNCGKMGSDSIRIIAELLPEAKIFVFTDFFHEHSLLRLIRDGAHCCLSKFSESVEICDAVIDLLDVGYYFSTHEIASMVRGPKNQLLQNRFLSDKEIEFMKLACSELTYKEIAGRMYASAHTIESYREDIFLRLGVKSRVGLVMFAMINGLFTKDDIREFYTHTL